MKPAEVHDVLVSIGATQLHHANTVTTSSTFLEEGALLSRGYVEAHGLKQTSQSSDSIDKRYGIWDAVFVDHVDIHYRGGRKKGPNQYGPILFELNVNALLKLPSETDVRVTKKNPIHWKDKQDDAERYFLSPEELRKNIGYGDFDKMLVIFTPTGRFEFPEKRVRIALDNPQRSMSNGEDAYRHAEQRLREAAKKGLVTADLGPHACLAGCACVDTYKSYPLAQFDSRFA
jgi:hypothetical protein